MHTELIAGIYGLANTTFAAITEPLFLALASAEALFQVNTLGVAIAVVHRVTRVDQVASHTITSKVQVASALGLCWRSRMARSVGRAVPAVLLRSASIDCSAELSLASVTLIAAATALA